jgi:hypothetical protein
MWFYYKGKFRNTNSYYEKYNNSSLWKSKKDWYKIKLHYFEFLLFILLNINAYKY